MSAMPECYIPFFRLYSTDNCLVEQTKKTTFEQSLDKLWLFLKGGCLVLRSGSWVLACKYKGASWRSFLVCSCCIINSRTLCSSNYSDLQLSHRPLHSIGLHHLDSSTGHLWRVLSVRRTCGWIQPLRSGKGCESAGWQSQTSQFLSAHFHGSLRKCCGHSSSSPSRLWNLVPMNKWIDNSQLQGNISSSTHLNSHFRTRTVLSPPLLYSVPSK